jgi:XTP/dITP diphosphohydrolase
MTNLDELIATANKLRAPGGCPWDAEQTHQSLTKYLIEESYELVEAIESGDREQILEELGDVLYQVIFHSDLAQSGSLGRHPHVFGTPEELERYKASNGEEVMQNWDAHKQREKPERQSVLDGIPKALPSLMLADKVIGKAQSLGVLGTEEPGSIEISGEDQLGALLLALVLAAKSKGLDAERALRESVRELEVEIRQFELSDDFDAGVIGR